MKKFAALMWILTMCAINAFADIRLPDTPKPKTTKTTDARMTIRIDSSVKEPKLIVPRDQIKQLRAQLDEIEGTDNNTSAAVNFTRVQTIVSGLFLSLAIVFGGVWVARSRKITTPNDKVLSIGAVLFLGGALATITFGNTPPPPIETRMITDQIFSPTIQKYRYTSGDIKLEVSDNVSDFQLIVPATKTRSGEE